MKTRVSMPRSKFLEIECRKCKEKIVIFNKASMPINCGNCSEEVVIPSGGHAYIRGRVLRVLA